MDYQRIYDQLITNAKKNNKSKTEYYEKHHILPRSMGGGDEKSNLVNLTARQHFIAHRLLEKITKGTPAHYKMLNALYFMSNKDKSRLNSKSYAKLRATYAKKNKIAVWERVGKKEKCFPIHAISKPEKINCHRSLATPIKRFIKNWGLREVTESKVITLIYLSIVLEKEGFESISFQNTAESNPYFDTAFNNLKKHHFLNRDGEFNKDILSSIESEFFEGAEQFYIRMKNITKDLMKTVQEVTPYARSKGLNLNTTNLIYLDKVSYRNTTKVIFKPVNNWLTLDNPIADLFYEEFTKEEALTVIDKLVDYQQQAA